MDIVVTGTVNDQQITLKSLCEVYGGTLRIPSRVFIRQSHIALRIDIVIGHQVRYGRHCHTRTIDPGITEHQVERHAASAAPAPNRQPRGIDKAPFHHFPGCHDLVARIDNTVLSIYAFSPLGTFQAWRAPVVYGNNNVTLLCEHHVPHAPP